MLNIYKASAGSGKTYQLAKEYIRTLVGNKIKGKYRLNIPKYSAGASDTNNRHRYILAITFTNKATEEMKKRIIDELDALSKLPVMVGGKLKDANYAEDLSKEFGCTREELAEASKKALVQLLNDYSNFNVTTIDSFFQRVLRTFARDLDRQGDFAVELDDRLAVQTSVGIMLDEYNRNPESKNALGNWLYNYMLRQIQSGGKSNFFNRKSHLYTTLVSLVSKICDERFKDYAIDMAKYLEDDTRITKFREHLRKHQAKQLDDIKAIATDAMKQLSDNGVTTEMFSGTYTKVRRLIEENLTAGVEADISYVLGTTIGGMAEGKSPFTKKHNVSESSVNILSDMFTEVRKIYTSYDIIDDIYNCTEQLVLLAHAWQYLIKFISDNNMILLSDTNHMLGLIIGNSDTPFIYERMGVQFRSFLIDEFQDTSRMQWRNIKPLVANGLDNGNDSLIIGDEKQSIYRFRNSDSSLLHTQVAGVDFRKEQYGTEIHGDKPSENTNYRSAADVVRFNNTLFKTLSANMGIEGFENVVQEISPKKTEVSGYVRIIPCQPPQKKVADDSQKDALDLMAENIIEQHEKGGYPWGDIAILVETNDEGAQAIERLMTKYPDIPVISDEALYLRKSHAVQLVVSMLKILDNEQPQNQDKKEAIDKAQDSATTGQQAVKKKHYPTNTEVSVAISRFRYFFDKGISADKAIEYAIDPSKAGENETIANSLAAIKARKPSSLISLVETIIHEIVPEHERKNQISFLNAFQDYVNDYCKHTHPTLRALLNDWENAKRKLSVASAAEVDAVRVMTIHKSKGLEFGCVHIPFGSWDVTGKPRGQWIELPKLAPFDTDDTPPAIYLTFKDKKYGCAESYFKQQYDDEQYNNSVDKMNLTYVAYTRAGRELTIYYQPEKGIAAHIDKAISTPTGSTDNRLFDLSEYYNTETQQLTIGSNTTYISENKQKTTDIMPINGYNVYFHKDADVITQVEDIFESGTDTAPGDENGQASTFEIDEEARQKGILLHDTLAKIQDINDIDRALRRISLDRRLDDGKRSELKTILKDMLDAQNIYIHRWFVEFDKVLNEQSILLPDDYVSPIPKKESEKEYDFRRPDRIVFHDGEVDVVDYKFTSKIRDEHKTQVKEYIYILKCMGYSKVNGFLWYPLNHGIIKITDI